MRPHENPGGLERRLALLTELAQTLERGRESLARCDAHAISAEASIPERLCRQWMELEPVSEASRDEEVLREQMAQMEARIVHLLRVHRALLRHWRPMPFSAVQAIQNVKRNASLKRGPSSPEVGLGPDSEFIELQTELVQELQLEIANHKIAVHREHDGLVISLREVGFFEPGSAIIRPDARSALDRIAKILRDRNYSLRIEGHTDNVPIHTGQFSSNWELSTARATELVRLLIVRNGFAADRLSAAGFAEYHPVASNRTPEGRAQNRRVDVVILGKFPAIPLNETDPATR